jgi:hypothetical protein
MPLDRAHVTVASRVMLPTYVLFFAVVGSNFLAGTFGRASSSPMLRYADGLMPIRVWGGLFCACALLMAAAMLTRNRYLYRYGLTLCCFSMIVWALVALVGIWVEPVSYSAWAWPGFVAAACAASNRSLAQGEIDQRRQGN